MEEDKFTPNLHVFKVSFIAATDTESPKLSIYSERYKERVTIDRNQKEGGPTEQAVSFLKSKGFNILGKGEASSLFYIISNTFNNLK